MAPDTYFPMCELLMRHGVEWSQARSRAVQELRHWDIDEVDAVLTKIQRPSPEYCLFKSADVEPPGLPSDPKGRSLLQQWWPSLYRGRERWISAPRALIAQSSKEDRALCVNADGEWSLRDDGFVALSHVWAEGLQRDAAHGGVEITKIRKVFELLRRAGLESSWVWTDVLVIPGGGVPTASLMDELLTTDMINSMPAVYGGAEAVLVMDAAVMQLHSTDPLDVAVALACGRWATRVWTFQEIKLASRAVVVTATGGVDFADVVAQLKELEAVDRPKYRPLYLWAAIMSKTDKHRLTIRDLVTVCGERSSGVDIDYARAFYPVLGIVWITGTTREEGMERIYRSRPDDTKVIAAFAGSPRMKRFPGWAPSYLKGLEGQGHSGLAWEARGLRGEWHVLKIMGLRGKTKPRYGKVGLNLEVEDAYPNVQCVCGPGEDAETLEAVEKMVKEGRGWILSIKSFAEPDVEWARSVLVVEQAQTSPDHGLEVAAHCTATMSISQSHAERKMTLLLRHWNPNVDTDLVNLVKYELYRQEETSLAPGLAQQDGENALHTAVRIGDVDAVKRIIGEVKEAVSTFDSRGYTPLHTAAARGASEILKILVYAAGDIEIRAQAPSKDTPLTLAASGGMTDSIRVLLDHGADLEARNDNGNTALMCAACECHAGAVSELLSRGANVNARNGGGIGESALILASGTNGRGVDAMKLLVEHGADVNAAHETIGWTPLLKATDTGSDSEVAYLLGVGAQPNVCDYTGRTPLAYAIIHAREESVKLLLGRGADRSVLLKDGLRPVHLAAECPNYKIMQMLLEPGGGGGGGGSAPDVNARAESGKFRNRTPLHMVAAKGGPVTVVKFLLRDGADAEARDEDGKTPLDLALLREDAAMISLLRDAASQVEG
ncbi:Ankyrin repeat-containing domain [Pleurostoma richardsiae]|uniref:Ankyrin repeat-containing domain n=1 Tax=Pleurostoma richardsiae TaxID=41990 RepID=A0AA38RRL5_9PEZI|nr:Ankyrin repeat-containing domain [Pleurostoma richardsiae]